MSVFARHRNHIICCSFDLYGFDALSGNQVKKWFDYCVLSSELTSYPFDEGCCSPGNMKFVLFLNCKRTLEKNLMNIETMELRSSADIDEIGSYGIMYANFSNKRRASYFGCHSSFFDYNQLTKIGAILW
jgi:hypothetical protein